jgi:hypothetical protein
MAKYKVDITSYDKFRAATLGKCYDIDGAFGAQCWDGAALLWQQLGRSLLSGDGSAKGCWLLKKSDNAGKDFDVIADKTKIRRGDVVIFGTGIGKYGHICFADADYDPKKSTLACYGENQGGTSGKGQASAFCVKNYNAGWILGAFRLKKWAGASAKPTATVSAKPAATAAAKTAATPAKTVTATVKQPAVATAPQVGKRYKIIKSYAGTSAGGKLHSAALGASVYVVRIVKNAQYPYLLASKNEDSPKVHIGWAQAGGLQNL